MNSVYTQYFQKSKVFLYPLLGIKQGAEFVPKNTYVSWVNFCSVSDRKFICVYEVTSMSKFIKFNNSVLKTNLYYESSITLNKNTVAVVFSFSFSAKEYDCIINGTYSKLSKFSKDVIEKFFSKKPAMAERINSFLFPEKHHGMLADQLGVDYDVIQNLHEICSMIDLKKETLTNKIPEEFGLYKHNSISLNK